MTAALRIETDPDALARVLRHPRLLAIDRHPVNGAFGRRYYPAVAAGAARAVPFAVVAGGEPLLYAPATIMDGRVSFYGMPLRLFLADGLDARGARRAVDLAFERLDGLASDDAPDGFVIETAGGASLDSVALACLGRGCSASLRLAATVDLAAGEQAWRAALRKSFRSLVNWGERAITLRYVNGSERDRGAFDAYQAFHHRIAGRVTRPQASWDAMFAWIAEGGGELALGHLEDGTLVSATLVVDGTDAAYYASGVYDRERFNKPMAHWPVWNALGRARDRGMAAFDLGEVPLARTASEKEVAIGCFKRGFATALETRLVWTSPARNLDA